MCTGKQTPPPNTIPVHKNSNTHNQFPVHKANPKMKKNLEIHDECQPHPPTTMTPKHSQNSGETTVHKIAHPSLNISPTTKHNTKTKNWLSVHRKTHPIPLKVSNKSSRTNKSQVNRKLKSLPQQMSLDNWMSSSKSSMEK